MNHRRPATPVFTTLWVGVPQYATMASVTECWVHRFSGLSLGAPVLPVNPSRKGFVPFRGQRLACRRDCQWDQRRHLQILALPDLKLCFHRVQSTLGNPSPWYVALSTLAVQYLSTSSIHVPRIPAAECRVVLALNLFNQIGMV